MRNKKNHKTINAKICLWLIWKFIKKYKYELVLAIVIIWLIISVWQWTTVIRLSGLKSYQSDQVKRLQILPGTLKHISCHVAPLGVTKSSISFRIRNIARITSGSNTLSASKIIEPYRRSFGWLADSQSELVLWRRKRIKKVRLG